MRTALVTGANRGIGLAVARTLAQRGDALILACRSPQAGTETARALTADGHRAEALALDLADPASVAAAVETLGGRRVDVLVNNAGVYRDGGILEVPMAAVRESMEVHFFGPLALCRALLPGMRERGYGRIVNVTSGYGALSRGLAGGAAYALSKAALNALTLRLAGDAGGGDLKINAADPGWVRTRMGGAGAGLSVEEGADTVVWLATLPASGPSGALFRSRRQVPW